MQTKLFILIALLLLSVSLMYMNETQQQETLSSTTYQQYDDYLKQYNFNYSSNEIYEYRFKIFQFNLMKIRVHNENLNSTYTLGITQFMTLTNEEFKSIYLGGNYIQDNNYKVTERKDLTANIDWVSKGVVTGIKNQGNCGSCWAFSATGNLEGIYAIESGILKSYSEQQLVDCSRAYGNDGCNGGLPTQAFQYVIQYGIETELQYPYLAYESSCHYNSKLAQVVIKGFQELPKGDCDKVGTSLASQPLSIGVDASNWQNYVGGVFSDCNTVLDHAVLLVGSTANYWTVKNSWGTTWGEKGYIRLAMGNTCGMCNGASTGNLNSFK